MLELFCICTHWTKKEHSNTVCKKSRWCVAHLVQLATFIFSFSTGPWFLYCIYCRLRFPSANGHDKLPNSLSSFFYQGNNPCTYWLLVRTHPLQIDFAFILFFVYLLESSTPFLSFFLAFFPLMEATLPVDSLKQKRIKRTTEEESQSERIHKSTRPRHRLSLMPSVGLSYPYSSLTLRCFFSFLPF